MKVLYFLPILFFIIIGSVKGQDPLLQLGVNAHPFKFLGGEVEGVAMVKLSQKVRSKLTIGKTNSYGQSLRSTCAVVDDVRNRIQKGWYTKFTIDYDLFTIDKMKIYAGIGGFHTQFESSGIQRYTDIELIESGDILAGGLELGGLIRANNFIMLDMGGQLFLHNGDNHQVGRLLCKGRIPGFDDAGSPLVTLFIHMLFGKRLRH